MGNYIKHFEFFDTVNPFRDTEKTHFGRIPAGIKEKPDLLAAIIKALKLPPYMGDNFDALEECIRTLDSIEYYYIILFHEDIPDLPEKELCIYFNVVGSAAEMWSKTTQHDLKIHMPLKYRDAMMRFLLV